MVYDIYCVCVCVFCVTVHIKYAQTVFINGDDIISLCINCNNTNIFLFTVKQDYE